jgi:hypothetical protein
MLISRAIKFFSRFSLIIVALLMLCSGCSNERSGREESQMTGIPRLEKQGAATQLMVDGDPFLILGGELHNSSSRRSGRSLLG